MSDSLLSVGVCEGVPLGNIGMTFNPGLPAFFIAKQLVKGKKATGFNKLLFVVSFFFLRNIRFFEIHEKESPILCRAPVAIGYFGFNLFNPFPARSGKLRPIKAAATLEIHQGESSSLDRDFFFNGHNGENPRAAPFCNTKGGRS